MASSKITEVVSQMLEGFLEENELALYNIEFVKEGKEWYLRVYIEKPEGSEVEYVDTDQCELVARFLSEKLDAADPIEQNYYLEVCSPGIDRVFIKDDDYRRFAGRPVDVSLHSAFEGHKTFTEAELVGLEDGHLVIKDAPIIPSKNKGAKPKRGPEVTLRIPREQVAQVKLSVIF